MPPKAEPVSQGAPQEGPVLLFDGVCNLCNRAVAFIVRRDPAARVRFASLQSPAGRERLRAHGLPEDHIDSLVLIDQGQAWQRSDAALRVAGYLRPPWSWLRALRVLPRPLRDGLYRWIARHRYRWFGKREACMVPDDELRSRFLS